MPAILFRVLFVPILLNSTVLLVVELVPIFLYVLFPCRVELQYTLEASPEASFCNIPLKGTDFNINMQENSSPECNLKNH